ncbi:hypothetical protein AB0M29_25385 [Streptomyces sp. NPDC051976]|jgi:hypothetical protein|uniref:hypothetical protein n=1 Tax=Streptomyces sp. NPDC051976 TaxID=3154947 RepID=UPI00341B47AA
MYTPAPCGAPRRLALYLRCYPYDAWGMSAHVGALHYYADGMGWSTAPLIFLDNGEPSSGPLPALGRLTALVARGWIDTVLVPGLWVFSLRDREAHERAARLEALGCAVQTVPSPNHRPAIAGVTATDTPPWLAPAV